MPRACFATKADITENNTKADAKTIEQAGWPGHIDSDWRLCQAAKVAGIGLVSKTSWSLTEMDNHGQSEALPASTLNIFWHWGWSVSKYGCAWLWPAPTSTDQVGSVHKYRLVLENFHVDSWNWQVLRDLTRLPQGFVGCWVWTSWAAYASANRVASEPTLKRLTVEPKRCFSIWRSSQNMLTWMFCTYSIS